MTRATAVRGLLAIVIGATAPCVAVAAPGVAPIPIPAPPHTAPSPAKSAYQEMTPAERVGQLFMVGVRSSGPSVTKLAHLRRLHVGSVILDGNSASGRPAVALTSAAIDAGLSRSGVAPFIATDQEGGAVQRLTGPGFSRMPSALVQGRWDVTKLRRHAAVWADQLSGAGIDLNLAPVADIVPAGHAHANQPIGRYDREYGHSVQVVSSHVSAVVRGESEHLAVTLKHFPGIGRATGNTDLARHVTDPTTRRDRYLAPFRAGIAAGSPFVMVSLARYPHIDHRLACFSATVMKTMLRRELQFSGVVISDSFHAAAVRRVPPAKAALRFFTAGGTMLLDTDPKPIHRMERAVLARARAHPAFAAAIKADVLAVLRAKADAGLVTTAPTDP